MDVSFFWKKKKEKEKITQTPEAFLKTGIYTCPLQNFS